MLQNRQKKCLNTQTPLKSEDSIHKTQMLDIPKKGVGEDMIKMMLETRSMSRIGCRDDKHQVTKDNIGEELNKAQPPRVPQVSWGLEGRCILDMISDTTPNGEHMLEQQERMEEFDQQGIGGNYAAGSSYQCGNKTTETAIKEPTLKDVFSAIQACNNSLFSLTNQMLDLKKDIRGTDRRHR